MSVDTYDISMKHFEFRRELGHGNFGVIYEVQKNNGHDKGCIYALKSLLKTNSENNLESLLNELQILRIVKNMRFLSQLNYAFEDNNGYHFVLDYCAGGIVYDKDLDGVLPESTVRFYAAEILAALDSLHRKKIMYRDLKPENILLDAEGHIVIIDFGLAKLSKYRYQRSGSLCGTLEFMAPEIHRPQNYGISADWWAYGVMICEMLTGITLFPTTKHFTNTFDINEAIKQNGLQHSLSQSALSLITDLLQYDPQRRLNVYRLKKHAFFENINFRKLKQQKPPYRDPSRLNTDNNITYDPVYKIDELKWHVDSFPNSQFRYIAPEHRQEVSST